MIDSTRQIEVVDNKSIKIDETMGKKLRNFWRKKTEKVVNVLRGLGARIKGFFSGKKEVKEETKKSKNDKLFEEYLEKIMDEATPEEERLKLISACNATIERLKADYEKFKDDSEISDEIKEAFLKKLNSQEEAFKNAVEVAAKYVTPKQIDDEEISEQAVEEQPKSLTAEVPEEENDVEEKENADDLADEKEEHKEIPEEEIAPDSVTDISDLFKEEPEKEEVEETEHEEVDYTKLTDEELQAMLDGFNNEYAYRSHQENGLVEHDDDLISRISEIETELNRRKKAQKEIEPEEELPVKTDEVSTRTLSDLTEFENYDEYLEAYCKANRKPEDYIKFFTDLRHDIRPQDLMAEEEFIDEKRRQIEKISQDEKQREIVGLKKQLSEKKIQLESAKEKNHDLERQFDDAKARLEEARGETISLSQNVADLEAEIANKEAQINRLNSQVRSTSSSLTQAQDRIYKQERTISEQIDEIKQSRETIANLEKELASQREATAAKEEELAKSQAKLASLMNNVTSQIKAAKDDAEDDIERAVLRHFEEQANKEVTTEKKTGPKHMKPKHFAKQDEVKEEVVPVVEPTVQEEPIVTPEEEPAVVQEVKETPENSHEEPVVHEEPVDTPEEEPQFGKTADIKALEDLKKELEGHEEDIHQEAGMSL